MKYLNELQKFSLPAGQFAIFGSGPMAIRGIRQADDLDVIVKPDLWKALIERFPDSLRHNPACLQIGKIEIFHDWMQLSPMIIEMIDNAEIISGFPFVQLKYVVKWKEQHGRDKDLKDIELINKFVKNQAAI